MMKKRVTSVLVLGAAILLSGCTGSPRGSVAVTNLKDATAVPPTSTMAPTIPATDVPATQEPIPATPTTAATQEPTSTPEFVAAWLIFGTPTPVGQSALEPTAVSSEPIATVATAVPTTTLPPTATVETVASVPTAGANTAPSAGGHADGNARAGQQVFTGLGGCSACHDVSMGMTVVGPTLKGIAARAATRETGVAAEDYLYESITNPNKYVVKGFSPGLMPQTFKSTLSAKQINDVIAYLMSLK